MIVDLWKDFLMEIFQTAARARGTGAECLSSSKVKKGNRDLRPRQHTVVRMYRWAYALLSAEQVRGTRLHKLVRSYPGL